MEPDEQQLSDQAAESRQSESTADSAAAKPGPPAQKPAQQPASGPHASGQPTFDRAAYDSVLENLTPDQRAIILAKDRKLNNESKTLRDRNKELEPKAKAHDEVVEAQRSAEEKAEQRAQAAEARARDADMRAVRAEVYATASDAFANPANAAPLLGDLTGYVDDKGAVDTEQIKADVARLLEDNPHLAKPTAPVGPRPPAPNPAQGGNAPTGKTSGTDAGREMFQNRRGGKKSPAA